jgi:hypothetical protein
MMDPADAAVRVLEEEGTPLHWTKIQDLALTRGYLDPFTMTDVRGRLLAALHEAVAEGRVRRLGRGMFGPVV